MADSRHQPAKAPQPSGEVAAFLKRAGTVAPHTGEGRGRLIFALDATMSRQPTWDRAQHLQAEMFEATAAVGGLDVQLVYFRGHGECRASRWVGDGRALNGLMAGIDCRGGTTQLGKVLAHARRETEKRKVNAVVFVGDAQEEVLDDLATRAGALGLLGVRLFMFQEGRDASVERAFRELARLTGGAYARFDPGAADELRQLLRAAAFYAAGGLAALSKSAASSLLIDQLR